VPDDHTHPNPQPSVGQVHHCRHHRHHNKRNSTTATSNTTILLPPPTPAAFACMQRKLSKAIRTVAGGGWRAELAVACRAYSKIAALIRRSVKPSRPCTDRGVLPGKAVTQLALSSGQQCRAREQPAEALVRQILN